MDTRRRVTIIAQRGASALALAASACAIGSLLLAAGLAYAWLTDHATVTNELSVEADEAVHEPYAALYADPMTQASTLTFDRGEVIPTTLGERKLVTSWRGMETGEEDFAQKDARPWESALETIDEIVCGESAHRSPIHILDMRAWFKEMRGLKHADVGGITPDTLAIGARRPSRSLEYIFQNCTNLESIGGIQQWNISGIESLEYAFQNCAALHGLNLSGWDVSSVIFAVGAFNRMDSATQIDITGWRLDACTHATALFGDCTALENIEGLEDLRCPNAETIAVMFANCRSLTRVDLSGFGMKYCRSLITNGLLSDCTSLRYVDLSGLMVRESSWSTAGTFPQDSHLETLILSNRFSIGDAPAPTHIATPSAMVCALGYWVSDETGEHFGKRALAKHLDETFDSQGPLKIMRYHADGGDCGPEDPYAALYQKSGGGVTLVMDKGQAAPSQLDGMTLLLEVRDILLNGERSSEAWRSYPIDEVSIRAPFTPLTCRNWFKSARDIGSIEGLQLLDMSQCADVTTMFSSLRVEYLDLKDWSVNPQAEGLENIFRFNSTLTTLDLSGWDAEVELNLTGLERLNTLTLSPSIRLRYLEAPSVMSGVRFWDAHWYAEGRGAPLNTEEVRERVNAAHGNASTPLMFTHERLDRAYAALYDSGTGTVLVFGRGLDVPDTGPHGTLIASYRGLEEQDMTRREWMCFHDGICPWSAYASSIIGVVADPSLGGDPIRPTNMDRWFQEMGNVQHLDALEEGALDASRTRSAEYLFGFSPSLEVVPAEFLSSFTSHLRSAQGMFSGCASLTSLPSFAPGATANLWNTYCMFLDCSGLKALDISDWDISSLRFCSSMFSGCRQLETLKLPPRFVGPQRPDVLQMAFDHCMTLRELDASDWDLSGSYTLFSTFNSCQSLERIIGAEAWDTSSVETMKSTFRQCVALTLDCSEWDVSAVEDATHFSLGAPGVLSPFEAVQALSEESEEPLQEVQEDANDDPREPEESEPESIPNEESALSDSTGSEETQPNDPLTEDEQEGAHESGEQAPDADARA